MMGSGCLKRAANISASNCVLSPISPIAMAIADIRKASMPG